MTTSETTPSSVTEGHKSRLKAGVLGVGGAGTGVIRRLAELSRGASWSIRLAAADTDSTALAGLPESVETAAVGGRWTNGRGCGNDPMLGEHAAADASDWFTGFIESHDFLFVVSGLGGGAGAGACQVLARLARDSRASILFVLTLPFSFEGNWRLEQARKSLGMLRELTTDLVVVPNDYLFSSLPADAPATEAFAAADRVAGECLYGMVSLYAAQPLLPVDYRVLGTLLREQPMHCGLAVGSGSGDNRWKKAIDSFLDSPLSGGRTALARAEGAMLALAGAGDMALGEIRACLGELQGVFPETARIVSGAFFDPRLTDGIRITGIVLYPADPAGKRSVPKALIVDSETPSSGMPRKKRKKPARVVDLEKQGELPLQIQTLGIFVGTEPTIVDGVNLDVPTYQRKGEILDQGD